MTTCKAPRSLDIDITSLLHRSFESERDTSGWDREDFLRGLGRMRDALIYSILFAPSFVEVEGLVFLAEMGAQPSEGRTTFAARVREAREQGAKELAHLLKGYNWVEIPYLFSDNSGTDEDVRILALAIADAWRARLRGLYPVRNFDVRVLPPSETGGAVGVGFAELHTKRA